MNASNGDVSDQGARQKIIDVAKRLFARNGFEGTSVRDIAKESGLNLSLISYYFGGKEGLYETIISDHAREMSSKVESVHGSAAKGGISKEMLLHEIRSLVGIFVEMKMREPDLFAILQREQLMGLPYAHKIHREVIEPVAEKVFATIEDAQKAGLFRSDIPVRTFFAILTQAICGYFVLKDCPSHILNDQHQFPQDKEKFIDLVMKVFSEGVFK